MSLKKIKDSFDKIKKFGEEYSNLNKDRSQAETKVKELKNQYKEGGVGKDVFSHHNKKLQELDKKMNKIRDEVFKLVQEINQDLHKEMQDVF
ncbi:MAG: hypothetical protein KKG75_00440 [Nanoarchaeota archaeon]|nr:hypothetical protein [Nanoarchaeota archaeon]